jgi:hypothetical protein
VRPSFFILAGRLLASDPAGLFPSSGRGTAWRDRPCDNQYVVAFAGWIRSWPLLARWVSISAVFAGVAGAIAGLVIGLLTYAPTAPFAAVELGVPAWLAGGVIGFIAGMIMIAVRRIRRAGPAAL